MSREDMADMKAVYAEIGEMLKDVAGGAQLVPFTG